VFLDFLGIFRRNYEKKNQGIGISGIFEEFKFKEFQEFLGILRFFYKFKGVLKFFNSVRSPKNLEKMIRVSGISEIFKNFRNYV
jgi:hypothetical protein